MVPLEDKNYYCIKHGKTFISYCIDCNCNICEDCKSSHPDKDNEHQLFEFDKLKPSKEDVNKLREVVKKHREKLKKFISSTKKLLDEMITTVESYIKSYIIIESSLIRRYNDKKLMNFQLIRNISNENIFKNVLFEDLEKYTDNGTSKERLTFLNKLYTRINEL